MQNHDGTSEEDLQTRAECEEVGPAVQSTRSPPSLVSGMPRALYRGIGAAFIRTPDSFWSRMYGTLAHGGFLVRLCHGAVDAWHPQGLAVCGQGGCLSLCYRPKPSRTRTVTCECRPHTFAFPAPVTCAMGSGWITPQRTPQPCECHGHRCIICSRLGVEFGLFSFCFW